MTDDEFADFCAALQAQKTTIRPAVEMDRQRFAVRRSEKIERGAQTHRVLSRDLPGLHRDPCGHRRTVWR